MNNIDVYIKGKLILENFSLNLALKESAVILGPNGAGKSTILELINRNLYPVIKKGSEIKLFGSQLVNIWELRKRIGFVMTDIESRINMHSLAWQVVYSGKTGKLKLEDEFNIRDQFKKELEVTLDLFDISEIKDKKYGSLSDGEKRKIIIARAMVSNPQVLILDEPYRNLDVKAKFNLMRLIENLIRNGTTILQVSHRIDTVTDSIERAIFIKDRKKIEDGYTNELFNSNKLSYLYGIDLTIKKINRVWHVYPKTTVLK